MNKSSLCSYRPRPSRILLPLIPTFFLATPTDAAAPLGRRADVEIEERPVDRVAAIWPVMITAALRRKSATCADTSEISRIGTAGRRTPAGSRVKLARGPKHDVGHPDKDDSQFHLCSKRILL
jgi:hypothetical protein